MAFIPKGAEWYIAEIVEEIRVDDDPRNVVLRNLTLIRADSPTEAYEKALRIGKKGEVEYDNPEAKRVRVSFRGISHLDVIPDKLEDGAELSFQSQHGVSQEEIAGILCPKEELDIFRKIRKLDVPDFTSAEVLQEVEDLLKRIQL
jgi:hypothetical protein